MSDRYLSFQSTLDETVVENESSFETSQDIIIDPDTTPAVTRSVAKSNYDCFSLYVYDDMRVPNTSIA